MIAYADTGFLVSLYGEDDKSPEATALIQTRPVFLLTSFGELEFANAIELRVFRRQWTRQEARSVNHTFSEHQAAGYFRKQELTTELWDRALALSRRHSASLGTRTLDLLHVAAALTAKTEVFYTFDARQSELARGEHLRVLPV